jgi:hypothetical protein
MLLEGASGSLDNLVTRPNPNIAVTKCKVGSQSRKWLEPVQSLGRLRAKVFELWRE